MNPVILCKQVSEELCKFISTEMRIMEGVIQELDPQSIRQVLQRVRLSLP